MARVRAWVGLQVFRRADPHQLAAALARKIASPALALAAAHKALLSGGKVDLPANVRIRELAEASDALGKAAAAVRSRESTARDAMMCNFKTIMITDGNAAMTDEDHNASLASFYLTFGDVMSTDTVIGFLRRNAGKDLAAAEYVVGRARETGVGTEVAL